MCLFLTDDGSSDHEISDDEIFCDETSDDEISDDEISGNLFLSCQAENGCLNLINAEITMTVYDITHNT